jgi:hypothetical protein
MLQQCHTHSLTDSLTHTQLRLSLTLTTHTSKNHSRKGCLHQRVKRGKGVRCLASAALQVPVCAMH